MKFHPDTVQLPTDTPLGPAVLAASPAGIAGIWFTDQRHRPPQLEAGTWRTEPGHPLLVLAAQQLADYLGGARSGFALPFDLAGGTPFQQRVWQALLGVPRGATTSYGALAASLGSPAAVRAVGSAVGRNPISVAVPCHRVVGAGGALTGYAGGLHRKAALLKLEGVAA